MGLVFYDVETYEAALNMAIQFSLGDGNLLDAVKNEVADVVQGAVDSYSPQFYSRRGKGGGGVADPSNMTELVAPESLTLYLTAGWQNKGFRYIDGRGAYTDLSDALESSQIYSRSPVAYVDNATEVAAQTVERELPGALVGRGF